MKSDTSEVKERENKKKLSLVKSFVKQSWLRFQDQILRPVVKLKEGVLVVAILCVLPEKGHNLICSLNTTPTESFGQKIVVRIMIHNVAKHKSLCYLAII